ncbi:hypothetical protein V6N11_082365 [Hibiscus sabdariffa]|uniref:Peptidase C1A papain C-terminal domain-containing protein n=1 Tax=Hibiscus sabdariffa TaxID=183260 RepID=A0ABR2PCB8_9ROSI
MTPYLSSSILRSRFGNMIFPFDGDEQDASNDLSNEFELFVVVTLTCLVSAPPKESQHIFPATKHGLQDTPSSCYASSAAITFTALAEIFSKKHLLNGDAEKSIGRYLGKAGFNSSACRW